MSSQNRYRTLVDNLARIHDATHEQRTGCLQVGLTKVLETINPLRADDWQQVKVDSMRLLRVWRAREDCQGDSELAEQILEALTDFATAEEALPRLEISEHPAPVNRVAAHMPIPVPILKEMTTDEAAAIEAALAAIDEEEAETETEAEVEPDTDTDTDTEDEDEDEDEGNETEEEVEVDEEVVATVPAKVEAEEAVAVAVAATEEESDVEAETEAEEEVVEPEADSEEEEVEEEEEGVEVEKRTIRGREYWISSDGILYAVTEDDEIGDEVGRINKEGRPVFLAPK